MVLFALAVLRIFADAHAADRSALTHGVNDLVAPGALVGQLYVAGENAFVVLTSNRGQAPLFAAASVGKGRVVAGAHEGFFNAEALRHDGNAQFLQNAFSWVGNKPLKGMRIGVLDSGAVVEALRNDGANPRLLTQDGFASALPHLDAVYMTQAGLDGRPGDQAALRKFIETGHGLVIAGPAWGWRELNSGKDLLRDNTGNAVLAKSGLGFADGTSEGSYTPQGAEEPLFDANRALTAVAGGNIPSDRAAIVLHTVERSLDFLPSDAVRKAIQGSRDDPMMPTSEKPVTEAMPAARLRARLEALEWPRLKPEEVRPHPTASSFPGAVPTGTPRIAKNVDIQTNDGGWHSTGLYAAPGEVVRVTLPAGTQGYEVRIGSHTDANWAVDKWTRFPEVSHAWPLRGGETIVASPFGGAIFIAIPHGLPARTVTVKIANAVAAPHFVRGKTTIAEWEAMKKLDAPWAELEGNKVVLSVPTYAVRNLQDPEALMKYWDEVLTNCFDLYAAPPRDYKERYCVDRQIAAGYMHSGYPIMTFDDVANTFTDLAKLRAKGGPTWGFYHEMGHNFQQGDWTFEGTGEVTNNLFSLYGAERLNAVTPPEYGLAHPAMAPKAAHDRLVKYLRNGARFEDWKNDPFLALTMYAELREGFGWAPFTHVFAEYQGLPNDQRPHSEVEKHDQWMVRFSRAVGKNLGPFFQAWGVPTSDGARQSTANLPAWMPADWPKSG